MGHKLTHLLTIGLIVVGFSGCSIHETNKFSDYEKGAHTAEYKRGAQAAARDIAHGKYVRLDCYGIIGPGSEEMEEILKRRYGIESRTDHSVGDDYIRGYNSTMRAASKVRFGNDYYEKALNELWKSNPGYGQFGSMPMPPVD
jgi:hypothetical protein